MATYGQYIEFGPYFNNGLLCTLKVYHYTAGTTTLKDVYAVRAKTAGTEAAQPVVSDSNGIVGFYADGLYKFRLDVATDGVTYSTLYTPDNWAVTDQSGTLSGEGAALSSASTLTLGTDGNFFHVTGAVTITAISGTQNEITLVFDSTPTLTHSGNLILQYAADYVAAANVTMRFANEGSNVWRELSRTPAFGAIDAAGDLIVGTANDTAARLAVGTAGQVLMMRTASTTKLAYNSVLTKLIHGLTWANNAGDATNDIDLAAGGCMDATGAYWMTRAALTKRSDATWAVGTNAGWLDTGAIGNGTYYEWTIARSDTGVVDSLLSLSATAPDMTLPTAAYDFKRLTGYVLRAGGAIVAFKTYEVGGGGVELSWTTPTLDVDILNTLTTSRRTDAVKVPLHFSVMANLRVIVDDVSVLQGIITCPDETDTGPSTTVAPLYNIRTQVAGQTNAAEMRIRTSATGTVAARALSGTFDVYRIVTVGFTWARRN